MNCKKCGGASKVILVWGTSQGQQQGPFCRSCAREMNPVQSRYGLTVTPIESAKAGDE